MNETVKICFGLIGGLALFLYGMNTMSDALQKTAGERMKKILSFLTKNPIMGALAGALVTAVLQSSSATTVMAIGFVSAGLMTLPQAISVIFGANIGTTMTAQLLAFKLSDYIYPIIFIGFMLQFVGKTEKLKNIGMVIFSFGLLFEGIEIMGHVMKPLAGSSVFVDLMAEVSSTPVLGVLLGGVMTLVVQSSSATIAVLQNFATQPAADGISSVIGLTGAIPILLGDNIGTTITAILASIGQTKNAQRTAIAHSIFNISGSLVCLCIIPLFAQFVQYISPSGREIDVISRQIANAHTTFNVVCTLAWLPFIPVMVKIVKAIIRGEDKNLKAAYEPQYLDNNLLDKPAAAMYLVSLELERLVGLADRTLNRLKLVLDSQRTAKDYEAFQEDLMILEQLQGRVTEYITKLLSGGYLTEQQSEETARLLFVTNNIQRMGERCRDMDEICRQVVAQNSVFSSAANEEIVKCITLAQSLLSRSVEAVKTGSKEMVNDIFRDTDQMRRSERRCNKAHLKRVKEGECHAHMTPYFSDLLYNLSRIADNCVSIAEEADTGAGFAELHKNAKKMGFVEGS
jgi:phosphate:Na+ symporter